VISNRCSCWKSQPVEKRVMKIAERISKKLDLSESRKAELNQIKEEKIKKFKSKVRVEKRRGIRMAFIEMIKEDSLTKEE
jgi:tellurite resistance protein